MKKSVSFIIFIAIILGLIGGAAVMSGVNLALAASATTDELWLKEGNIYALANGEKKQIKDESTAPYKDENSVYFVPLSALCVYHGAVYYADGDEITVVYTDKNLKFTVGATEYMGKALDYAPFWKGEEVYLSVKSVEVIFGFSSFVNQYIGLIVFSDAGSMTYSDSTYASLKVQVNYLGNLLFDTPTGEEMYSDVENNVGVQTHPRIMVDQDRFDYLKWLYDNTADLTTDEDASLALWVHNYVVRAEGSFSSMFEIRTDGSVGWISEEIRANYRHPYFLYDEEGNRLEGQSTYTDSNGVVHECTGSGIGEGYDEGGRLSTSGKFAKLKEFAFAYQITGEQKYVDAFYLLGVQFGTWAHWGEGHFLNCADNSVEFAIGLDWIYHGFDSDTEKRDELYDILYRFGLMKGYYSIKNQKDKLYLSSIMGGGWSITNRDNNWATVCDSGMIVSALVLMEKEEYRANCEFVITTLMETVKKCFMQYAPDGAYIESAGYWTYGTETYFIMLAAIESSAGTDYGYFDTIGLRESCYAVNYFSDSDGYAWNYHDGASPSIVDRECFFLASKYFADPNIALMRENLLFDEVAPVKAGILDILFYDKNLSMGGEEITQLDYNSKSMDTVTFRSSFERGAIFGGLHAGANVVAHGDNDCGHFYYKSNGIYWFGDPGTEDYNVGNYFNNSVRYKYYKKSAESHNTIIINSSALPLGQVQNNQNNDYAKIVRFESDEYGTVAVANMKPQYGSTCVAAERGILFTNSRSTLVVQDEITFSSPTSLTWIADPSVSVNNISADGRTATFVTYKNGMKGDFLRLTLISDNPDLKFEKTKDTLLPNTITSADNPKASSAQTRLIIRANNVTEFNVAVVIESYRDEREVVGYKYSPISEWQTTSDEWVKEANEWIVIEEEETFKYKLSDLIRAISEINGADNLKEKVDIINRTYVITTDIDMENAQIKAKLDEYMELIGEVNEQIDNINRFAENGFFNFGLGFS